MSRQSIQTDKAPKAIGSYSQAIRTGETVYLSGQIPLDPASMKLIDGPIEQQIERVFKNLAAVAEAAGGSLANVAKLTVYLTDLSHFPHVNEVMARFFEEPYPARAAIGVAALPLGAPVEIDAILVLDAEGESSA
jgi:reactive intermediate/imine deaminase